jgi:hypothetical protein
MAKIKAYPREFEFRLNEHEVCDLVIAISKYNVHPNAAHQLMIDLVKQLGYTPRETPDI